MGFFGWLLVILVTFVGLVLLIGWCLMWGELAGMAVGALWNLAEGRQNDAPIKSELEYELEQIEQQQKQQRRERKRARKLARKLARYM